MLRKHSKTSLIWVLHLSTPLIVCSRVFDALRTSHRSVRVKYRCHRHTSITTQSRRIVVKNSSFSKKNNYHPANSALYLHEHFTLWPKTKVCNIFHLVNNSLAQFAVFLLSYFWNSSPTVKPPNIVVQYMINKKACKHIDFALVINIAGH